MRLPLGPIALAAALAGVPIGSAAELNVKNVVLYKHGVGYFERSGDLAAGQGARLDFKASEMNDVLKSLTIEVKGGGGVSGLRYDSSEPLARKLEQFPLSLDKTQPISSLLDQLKGSQIELKVNDKSYTGLILGARLLAGSREQPEKEQLSLLHDGGEIRTYDIGWSTPIKFTDAKLQLQLKEYLNALTQSRSSEKRSVYIDSVDAASRQVTASYMVPTPVWKSSYRLIFPQSGEPTLEGWAIVDNTTGEDWVNIRLALVSGRPISFISRLYEPKYVDRPVAELADDRPVGPVLHQGAIGGAMPPPAPAKAAMPRRGMMMAELAAPSAQARDELASNIESVAEGRELGDLFEYSFSKPVTVKKSESAMLPFLQQKLPARKLLIYSNEFSPHPMNAAELTNNSGKTLDGGPVTLYDGGAYAGEALFETIKTGDKRLVSYGVDIGTRITTKFDSTADVVREIHLRNGVLTTKSSVQETKTYTIKNVDAKAKTLIIEYPVRYGYKLQNQKPLETTVSAYRFEVKLAPSAESKFPVQEERQIENTFAISNINPLFLASILQNKAISAQGRKALESISDRKRQVAELDSQINESEGQIKEIVRDQERIRQNLTSLNRVTGQQDQVARYANQLSQQEGQLASLRDRQSDLRKKKTALEAEINTLIQGMEF